MVKHIILWTLNPELSEAEKSAVKAGIKEGLEGLVGKVPGLIDVKVHIDGRLASSNADVMLDSTRRAKRRSRLTPSIPPTSPLPMAKSVLILYSAAVLTLRFKV